MTVLQYGALLPKGADTILSPSFIHYQRTSCTGKSSPLFLKGYDASLPLNMFMDIILYEKASDYIVLQIEGDSSFSLNLKNIERRFQQYGRVVYFQEF